MKLKVIIVAIVMWAACVLGGGTWGRFEEYLRTRSIPPGQLEVQDLKHLYEAQLFDEVLGECDHAEHDPRYTGYEPQIMYIRWATDLRLGRTDEAGHIQQTFLHKFPNHVLAADIHFSKAMNLLAAANYKESADELEIIHSRYPNSSIAGKADEILRRLRNTDPTTPAAVIR
jgi:hypothetical protein